MRIPFLRRSQPDEVEAMYRQHAPCLLAYARSFGLDSAAAEDAVQQVFLRLIELSKLPEEPRPYLFRAVRNSCLNRQRDRKREADTSTDEPWFAPPDGDRLRELDLRRAVRKLPPEQSEVIMMHVWGGLSFDEVAAVTQTSPNTAASRYRYALAALRRSLEGEGV